MAKKYTVFISDTHFSEDHPEITQRFIDLLANNKTSIESLYLLGDLFDAWIGDDNITALSQKISDALSSCSNAGIKIYFIHGNRDYLIGKKFAAACKMTLLADKTVITLYGKKILLMHGDLLCTDDYGYQRYRKIMFSPLIKKLSLLLPLSLRRRIAKKLRKTSQDSNARKSMKIMDVSENSVIQALEEHQVELLIHGHTHRPCFHENRIVLGAWENNRGNALIATEAESLRFIEFDQAPTNLQRHTPALTPQDVPAD